MDVFISKLILCGYRTSLFIPIWFSLSPRCRSNEGSFKFNYSKAVWSYKNLYSGASIERGIGNVSLGCPPQVPGSRMSIVICNAVYTSALTTKNLIKCLHLSKLHSRKEIPYLSRLYISLMLKFRFLMWYIMISLINNGLRGSELLLAVDRRGSDAREMVR